MGDETFNIDTNCKSCSFGRVTRVEGASSPDECDGGFLAFEMYPEVTASSHLITQTWLRASL